VLNQTKGRGKGREGKEEKNKRKGGIAIRHLILGFGRVEIREDGLGRMDHGKGDSGAERAFLTRGERGPSPRGRHGGSTPREGRTARVSMRKASEHLGDTFFPTVDQGLGKPLALFKRKKRRRRKKKLLKKKKKKKRKEKKRKEKKKPQRGAAQSRNRGRRKRQRR